MESQNSQEVLFRSSYDANFQFSPIECGFTLGTSNKKEIDLAAYNLVEVYREPLASTSVSQGKIPNTDQPVAIKKIYKERLLTDSQKVQAAQEFPLHCSLNHLNILKGMKWGENDQEYIMVMEYANHANYFQDNKIPITDEIKLRLYAKGILEGLVYLHSKGIVHGDIKPENILLHVDPEEEASEIIKICDFGLSRKLQKDTGTFYMETPVGTHSYLAPEITSKSYVNEKIDIWALGMCLYEMAVAYKPNRIPGYKSGSVPIPFLPKDWNKRPELEKLIKLMLETSPETRISATEALKHPWFQT